MKSLQTGSLVGNILILLNVQSEHIFMFTNNPEGISSNTDKIRFHPYYTSKDLIGFI